MASAKATIFVGSMGKCTKPSSVLSWLEENWIPRDNVDLRHFPTWQAASMWAGVGVCALAASRLHTAVMSGLVEVANQLSLPRCWRCTDQSASLSDSGISTSGSVSMGRPDLQGVMSGLTFALSTPMSSITF